MNTYQVWIPASSFPLDYIEAVNSFEARKLYARKYRVAFCNIVARQLRPSERLSG